MSSGVGTQTGGNTNPGSPELRTYRFRKVSVPTRKKTVFELPNKVFTVFCEGTGGHRDGRCLELITEFAGAYWGRGEDGSYVKRSDLYDERYMRDFLILDGPGAVNMYLTAPDQLETAEKSNYQEGYVKSGHPYYSKPPREIGFAGSGVDDLQKKAESMADPTPENPNPIPGDFKFDDRRSLVPPFSKPLKTNQSDRTSHHLLGLKQRVKIPLIWSGDVKVVVDRGLIYGEGMDDNVAHALFVLKKLLDDNRFPQVINMVGWSRGAVTCIKLANAIYEYFVRGLPYKVDDKEVYPGMGEQIPQHEIDINLFAIDPVPGLFGITGEDDDSWRSKEKFPESWAWRDCYNLPPIIRDCIATLALDEQRTAYAPVDLYQARYDNSDSPADGQNVVFLPFPGQHKTQLRMEPRDPGDKPNVRHKLTAVPHIVFDLAWKFLTRHGSKFQVNYLRSRPCFGGGQLTLEQIVEKYSEIMLLREDYHQARNLGISDAIQGGSHYPRRCSGIEWKKLVGVISYKEKHDLDFIFRNADGELAKYVRDFRFFVNEHHRACFEKAYPALYKWLFTPESSGELSEEEGDEFAQTLQALQNIDQDGSQHTLKTYALMEERLIWEAIEKEQEVVDEDNPDAEPEIISVYAGRLPARGSGAQDDGNRWEHMGNLERMGMLDKSKQEREQAEEQEVEMDTVQEIELDQISEEELAQIYE